MRIAIPFLIILLVLFANGCGEEEQNTEPVSEEQPATENLDLDAIANREADVLDRVGRLRIGIERYAAANDGQYPPEISLVLEHLAVETFPENPFTNETMENIKFGTRPSEGNFTYLPILKDGIIGGYYLIGYGSEETDGEDINNDRRPDHVIEVISNSREDFEMPAIADALEMLRKSGK